MATTCYCGSGFYCPSHPNIPPFSSGGTIASIVARSSSSFAPNTQLQSGKSLQPQFEFPASDVAWNGPKTPIVETNHRSSPAPMGQSGVKRPSAAIAESSGSKRLRIQTESPSTHTPLRSTSLRQIQVARLAASSVPPTYHVEEDSLEGVKRIHAARAIDCWYFFPGARSQVPPSEEEIVRLQLSDRTRAEGTSLDLRRPSEPRVRCTECLKSNTWRTWKNYDGGGLANHLRRHLQKEHAAAYYAACDRIGYTPERAKGQVGDDDNVCEPLSAEGVLKYITEWFAEDDISFNMVTHRGFRRFFSYISQGKLTTKDIPDRHTIALKAQKLSQEAKDKIKKEIKRARGRISCTSDLWTDETQRAFMSLTVHFVNRHKRMVNRLIGFRVIEGSHAGSNLAETFFEILEEFGVTKKLGLITLDNASNNDTLMAQLEAYMVKEGLDFDRHGNRLRCFPHVINLAVQAILAALPSSSKEFRKSAQRVGQKIDDQLERYLLALESEPHNRVRRAAGALRTTQRRQGLRDTIREGNEAHLWRTHKLVDGVWRLEEFQMKSLEFILDCPTRWSSTRDMIHRFLYLYPAASRYIASDPSLAEHAITHMDYEVLSDVLDALNLAHHSQELLSSDRTPTLSLAIPLYHGLVDQWRELQLKRPALSHAIGAGIAKIETYLEKTRSSPAHIVAMALNPSIRYDWIDQNWAPEEASNAREVVKAHMLRCLEEEQRERAVYSTPTPAPRSTDSATKRLNRGYGALIASRVSTRPTSALVSSEPSHLTVANKSPTSDKSWGHTPSSSMSDVRSNERSGSGVSFSSRSKSLNLATVELEHQKFLEEPVVLAEDIEGLSPIDYWLAKSSTLPLIYKVAVDILPAQASSVSSERVFSSSKMTCTQFRNKISASNVEALQILKHSLRSSPDTPDDNGPDTLDFMTHHIDDLLGDTIVQTFE